MRIVVAILIIIAVMLFLFVVYALVEPEHAAAEQQQTPLVLMLPPSKWDGKIIELDKQALDEAYLTKMRQLFDVFVREGTDFPERPVKGAAQARRAYMQIMQAIEVRQQAIEQRERK